MAKDNITWWQVNNWVPLIVFAITITVTYGALFAKVAVADTKIDLLLKGQEEFKSILVKQEARDVAMEVRITALETVNTIKK